MTPCPECGGTSFTGGRCRMCGALAPSDAVSEPTTPPLIEPDADPDAAQEGVRALLRLLGEDPDREGLRDTPEVAVRTLCGLADGYDRDPATLLAGAPRHAGDPETVLETLREEVLCERCLTPMTVDVELEVDLRPGSLSAAALDPLARAIARRLHTPAGLAEQLAAAPVDLGGSAGAACRVTVLRRCAGGCSGTREHRRRRGADSPPEGAA